MKPNKHHIIYLACPYTHISASVRAERFDMANKIAAAYIRGGEIVFSPITMTHPIDVIMAKDLGTLGSDYWVAFDEAFMDFCSEMRIIAATGWDKSSGIRREIDYFQSAGKPVYLIDPNDPLNICPFEVDGH